MIVRHVIVAAALLTTGCAGSVPRFTSVHRPELPPAQLLEGVASYYAEEFNGRTTANGEEFNMHAMTAAHRTLPFNTRVRVKNLENGKSVIVRINDRGPFKDDRVIDLSMEAARLLGMIGPGTAKVSLEPLTGQNSD